MHFEAMANILSPFPEGKVKEELIDKYVKLFSESNPRFDENRFREACESS
jgi:hypothetical protein